MTTTAKKSVNAVNWKVKALEMRAMLPKYYTSIYQNMFKDADEAEIVGVREFLNARKYDAKIEKRLKKMIAR